MVMSVAHFLCRAAGRFTAIGPCWSEQASQSDPILRCIVSSGHPASVVPGVSTVFPVETSCLWLAALAVIIHSFIPSGSQFYPEYSYGE